MGKFNDDGFQNPASGSGGLVWHDLATAHFADLNPANAPNEDPFTIMDSALTFPATGRVRIQTTEQGTARDDMTEGAWFRMEHLPEFVGDGRWGYVWEFWPNAAITPVYAFAGFGVCDQDGSPAGNHLMAAGAIAFTPTTIYAAVVDRVSYSSALGGSAVAAGRARVIWTPSGGVGNTTQVGASDGDFGSLIVNTSPSGGSAVPANGSKSATDVSAKMSGATYPGMIVGWQSVGAETIDLHLNCRWAAFPIGYAP